MFVRYCVINVVENYVYIAYGEVNTAWNLATYICHLKLYMLLQPEIYRL